MYARLTNPTLGTSTDLRYVCYAFDSMTNLGCHHEDVRVILHRGVTGSNNGVRVADSGPGNIPDMQAPTNEALHNATGHLQTCSGARYNATKCLETCSGVLYSATERLQACSRVLYNATERLQAFGQLQCRGPVPGDGMNDIAKLLPWLAMPTYLKTWRCIDLPLSPGLDSIVDETGFDEVLFTAVLDESPSGQAFSVEQSKLYQVGFCVMVCIALMVLFGFLILLFLSMQPSTRTAQASDQRQSHQHRHSSTPLPQLESAATNQDNDTPGLNESSSGSPAGSGGLGMLSRSQQGSGDVANAMIQEMGFEDLHWVIQQSSLSGFAVIFHDVEAALNPRCHKFLQKRKYRFR